MTAVPPLSRKLIDIREGECIAVGDGVVMVELVHKTGRQARLQISAPRDVAIEKRGTDPVRAKHDKMTA